MNPATHICVEMSSPTRRGLTHPIATPRIIKYTRRNEFPDEKGIDTSEIYIADFSFESRNEFPDEKGIDTCCQSSNQKNSSM